MVILFQYNKLTLILEKSLYKFARRYFHLNNSNLIQKKWLVLIAALLMISYSLKDFNFNQLESLALKDLLPIIVLTALVILLKTSIISVVFLSIQKLWNRLTKKSE